MANKDFLTFVALTSSAASCLRVRIQNRSLITLNGVIFFCPFPGSLAWLDGSDVSYSNWVNMPDVQAACGHILRHSGFQWEATENCSQELNFICQFGMHTYINQHITLNFSCICSTYISLDFFFFTPQNLGDLSHAMAKMQHCNVVLVKL